MVCPGSRGGSGGGINALTKRATPPVSSTQWPLEGGVAHAPAPFAENGGGDIRGDGSRGSNSGCGHAGWFCAASQFRAKIYCRARAKSRAIIEAFPRESLYSTRPQRSTRHSWQRSASRIDQQVPYATIG